MLVYGSVVVEGEVQCWRGPCHQLGETWYGSFLCPPRMGVGGGGGGTPELAEVETKREVGANC